MSPGCGALVYPLAGPPSHWPIFASNASSTNMLRHVDSGKTPPTSPSIEPAHSYMNFNEESDNLFKNPCVNDVVMSSTKLTAESNIFSNQLLDLSFDRAFLAASMKYDKRSLIAYPVAEYVTAGLYMNP